MIFLYCQSYSSAVGVGDSCIGGYSFDSVQSIVRRCHFSFSHFILVIDLFNIAFNLFCVSPAKYTIRNYRIPVTVTWKSKIQTAISPIKIENKNWRITRKYTCPGSRISTHYGHEHRHTKKKTNIPASESLLSVPLSDSVSDEVYFSRLMNYIPQVDISS